MQLTLDEVDHTAVPQCFVSRRQFNRSCWEDLLSEVADYSVIRSSGIESVLPLLNRRRMHASGDQLHT